MGLLYSALDLEFPWDLRSWPKRKDDFSRMFQGRHCFFFFFNYF
jgi:hypothetical protein